MGLLYPPVAVNRAMKRNEIILKAMSGELSWIRAAEICRITARQMRRLKWAYQKGGYTGLLDRRTGRPSPKRASFPEVERILRLYREEYPGFNMRHFHQKATELHGVKLGYTFVRKALQGAGLVSRRTRRGPHRKRRERKGSLGEMLHLDGSLHVWLSLVPEEKQTLIAIVDDATGKVLEAQLVKAEGTQSVLEALYEVVKIYGIPMALYTDRAGWAFHTPKAGGKVNKDRLTTVGKVLAKLGVEAIPAYSPEARGRGERLNRTFQDRLVNELRVAGIRTREEANRYLRETFLPDHNRRYSVAPSCAESAFVPVGSVDLDQIFCVEDSRKVGKDNTLTYDGVRMQLDPQVGRATCAHLRVTVRRHLDGHHSVWHGVRCLGTYDGAGKALPGGTPTLAETAIVDPGAKEKTGKSARPPKGAGRAPDARGSGEQGACLEESRGAVASSSDGRICARGGEPLLPHIPSNEAQGRELGGRVGSSKNLRTGRRSPSAPPPARSAGAEAEPAPRRSRGGPPGSPGSKEGDPSLFHAFPSRAQKIESRPDLAPKTSKQDQRGRNRRLTPGPGFSPFAPIQNPERRKPQTGQITCQSERTS